MTFRQKAQRETLKKHKLNCLHNLIDAFDSFYLFYLKMLEKYESVDDIPYPQREKLLRLANIYHRCDEDYRKSIRSIYNFDKIVYDEELEYNLDLQDLKVRSKVSAEFYKRRLGRCADE